MTRMILLTFAFLGACLYYLSGGQDFEPRGVRGQKIATAAPAITAQPVEFKGSGLTTSGTDAAPEPVKPTTAASVPKTRSDETREVLASTRLDLNESLSGLGQDNPLKGLKLASLEEGLIGLQRETAPENQTEREFPTFDKPEFELRYITGSRVNVRQGPGTNYGVMARLVRGDEVEVLSNPGNGWLRLRLLPDQQIGWISESLVSASGY
jgi:hypothetical protein